MEGYGVVAQNDGSQELDDWESGILKHFESLLWFQSGRGTPSDGSEIRVTKVEEGRFGYGYFSKD